jgi:DNA-binding NarL/FixJ family response regulator
LTRKFKLGHAALGQSLRDELRRGEEQGTPIASGSQIHAIRVGVMAGEPIRLEGLTSIFDREPEFGQSVLTPVFGELSRLLADKALEYIVIDLNSPTGGMQTLTEIRRARPDMRLIVIGPAGNDELVLDSIVGGARAYLDVTAGPRVVREAIEVVVSGSIWAPRRLLSTLIDRLLSSPEGSLTSLAPHLTIRERQVLDLILLARSNREIARELGIEERTVKAHVGRLMRKTGAENRIDLSMRALNGLLAPKPGI